VRQWFLINTWACSYRRCSSFVRQETRAFVQGFQRSRRFTKQLRSSHVLSEWNTQYLGRLFRSARKITDWTFPYVDWWKLYTTSDFFQGRIDWPEHISLLSSVHPFRSRYQDATVWSPGTTMGALMTSWCAIVGRDDISAPRRAAPRCAAPRLKTPTHLYARELRRQMRMPDTRTDRREYRANVSKVQGDVSNARCVKFARCMEERTKTFYLSGCKHYIFTNTFVTFAEIPNGKIPI